MCVCLGCVLLCLCLLCVCVSVSAVCVGPNLRTPPPQDRPKFRSFFSFSHTIFIFFSLSGCLLLSFFLSLGVFSWNFGLDNLKAKTSTFEVPTDLNTTKDPFGAPTLGPTFSRFGPPALLLSPSTPALWDVFFCPVCHFSLCPKCLFFVPRVCFFCPISAFVLSKHVGKKRKKEKTKEKRSEKKGDKGRKRLKNGEKTWRIR